MALKRSKQWHRERAWRTYRLQPTRLHLRQYEIWKARQGHFAERMFDYYGGIPHVEFHRVRESVRRAYALGLVCTATTNGTHAEHSYHALGQANDSGLIEKEVGTEKGRERLVSFQRQEFEAWQHGHRPHLVELIGPDNNMVVLNGRHSPLREGDPLENQHDNHVHTAFTR